MLTAGQHGLLLASGSITCFLAALFVVHVRIPYTLAASGGLHLCCQQTAVIHVQD